MGSCNLSRHSVEAKVHRVLQGGLHDCVAQTVTSHGVDASPVEFSLDSDKR